MAAHPGNCPPSGLFEAGIDELIAQNPDTEYDEHYQPYWAYDGRLFGTYGLIAVKPGGEFEDAPGPKQIDPPRDEAPSDGCSGGQPDIKLGVWDRRVACGAHDYCWSLLSFGVSRRLAKGDCDTLFEQMLKAECVYRKAGRFSTCNTTASIWPFAVEFIYRAFDQGTVRLRNVATGSCMHVRPAHTVSSLDTVGLLACVDGSSTQEFTFLKYMLGVRLKRTSTGGCISRLLQSASVVSGTTLRMCEGEQGVFLISDNGTDRYLLKEQSGEDPPPGDQRPTMSDSCWAPDLALNGSSITSQDCDVSRDRFLWEIEEVG